MPPKIYLVSIFILFTSCVSEVDFDQSDELTIEPTYVASLFYFTFDQSQFLADVGNMPLTITDSSNTPLNASSIANEHLTKAEIHFKVSNTFNRSFVIRMRFFDVAGNSTFIFLPITVLPNTPNQLFKQTIQGVDLAQFVQSQNASIEVVLLPSSDGSVIDPTIPKLLNVQVSGIFEFNLSN